MYPPQPQQPPPWQPPPPPMQPKRHRLRWVIVGVVGVLIVIGITGGALAGSHPKAGGDHTAATQRTTSSATSAPSTPAATPTPTPSLSGPERRFVADMRNTFNWDASTTDATIASVGAMVCAARAGGSSQGTVKTRVAGQVSGGGAGQITKMAEQDMCRKYVPPPPKPKVIDRFNGSGDQSTPAFTVPATWHLSWAYWGCDGGSGNFIVNENNTDGQPDYNGIDVNELGSGRGPVATFAFGDGGRHYFQVISECSWSLAVVTGGRN